MKTRRKMGPAMAIAGLLTATGAFAQTTGYVPKWNGSAYVNTATPIYEDATHSRIGIGNTSPLYKLDVNGDINCAAGTFYMAGQNFLSNQRGTAVGNNALLNVSTGVGNTAVGVQAGNGTQGSSYNVFLGLYAGALGDGSNNTCVGAYSNANNSSATDNTCLGYQTGYNNGASNNMFIGSNSGYSNISGTPNTFIGYNAGYNNTYAGQNIALGYEALKTQSYSNASSAWSSNNVALGNSALYSNQPTSTSNGINNTAAGHNAMYTNTTGYDNAAFGYQAMYSNTTGVANGAFGYRALYANTSASNSHAFGYNTLSSATTGGGHTAMGHAALANVTTNAFSSAFGYEALLNTTGTSNTAIGAVAGLSNTTGAYNTFVGYGTTSSANTYTNCASLGYNASAGGSDQIRIGNANATVYCQLNVWSSDGRFKFNVKEDVKGLEFIKKLRPVTYQFDTKKLEEHMISGQVDSIKAEHMKNMDFKKSTAVVHSGFIAQEVEQAAKETGFSSSIVHAPDNSNDHYGIAYGEIVVPLVKAVQEQQKMIEDQNKKIEQLTDLVNKLTGSNTNSTGMISVDLSDKNTIVLNQNIPNPFAEQTAITYNVPENVMNAQLIIYNNVGQVIKSVDIRAKGKGQLTVFAGDLSSGIYTYSLVLDGKTVETKKMVKQ